MDTEEDHAGPTGAGKSQLARRIYELKKNQRKISGPFIAIWREGENVIFSKEARERYLTFAINAQAAWSANFRDLSASVTRMATLAPLDQ